MGIIIVITGNTYNYMIIVDELFLSMFPQILMPHAHVSVHEPSFLLTHYPVGFFLSAHDSRTKKDKF